MSDVTGPVMRHPSSSSSQSSDGAEVTKPKYKDNIVMFDISWFYQLLPFGLGLDHDPILWFVKDWTGIVAVIGTWILLISGEIIFFLFVILPFRNPLYRVLNGAFNLICALLGLVAHFQATFTNPVSRSLVF